MVWPVNIGDTVVFHKQTHDSTGMASSADSMPEFFVFGGTSTSYIKASTMIHLTLGDGLYQGRFTVQSSTFVPNTYGSIITYAAVGGITAADVTPFFIMPTTVARVGANTVSISSGAITNLTFTASALDETALAASAINKISTSINTWSSGIQTTLLTDIRAVSTAEEAALKVWSSGIQTAILSTMARNVWSAIGSSYTSSDTLGYHLWSLSTSGTGGSTDVNVVSVTSGVLAVVWDTTSTAHLISGTVGAKLNSLSTSAGAGSTDVNVVSISAGVLAPVWDTTSTAHLIAGTFGEKLYSLSTSAGSGSTDVNVVSMSAGVINEAAFTSSAIGSSALAASAINKISTSINTWSSGIQTVLLAASTAAQAAITSTMDDIIWNSQSTNYTSTGTFGWKLGITSTGGGAGSTNVNVVSISSGAITNLSFTASAIDANALATDAVGEIQSSLVTSSDLVAAVWNAQSTDFQSTGTMGYYVPLTSTGGSTNVHVVSMSSGVITNLSFTASAITAATVSVDFGSTIADAVWQSQSTDFQSTGTLGWKLGVASDAILDIQSSLATVVDIENAVWDATSTDHLIAGTMGAKIYAMSTSAGSGSTDVNVVSMSSGVVTNLTFSASAINAAALATDAVTEIQSSLATSSDLAAAIWNAQSTDYQSTGTMGYYQPLTSTGGSTNVHVVSMAAGVISSSVVAAGALAGTWDTTSTSHLISGTVGAKLASLSTATGGGSTDVNVVSMSAGVINEAAFTSSAIGSSALAASAVNKISTSINTWSSGIQTTLFNQASSNSSGIQTWSSGIQTTLLASNTSQSSGIYTWSSGIQTTILADTHSVSTAEQAALQVWSSGIQSYLATWTSAIQTQLLVTSSSAQSALQTWTSGIQTAILSSMPTVTQISTAISAMTGADPAGVFHPSTHWMAKLDWLANDFLSRQTMNRVTGLTTIYNASTAAVATFTAADDGTTFTRPKRS